MKKWIITIIMVTMVGYAVVDFVSSRSEVEELKIASEIDDGEGPEIGLNIGNRAPDFKLETLTGEEVQLSDFRGRRVMLNFWATWCPPCRAEMPDMEKFHQNTEIVILAVNLTNTEASRSAVDNFVDDYNLTFPILIDIDSAVSSLYAIRPVPTTYMIDSKGIIRNFAFGAVNYDQMIQEYEKMN